MVSRALPFLGMGSVVFDSVEAQQQLGGSRGRIVGDGLGEGGGRGGGAPAGSVARAPGGGAGGVRPGVRARGGGQQDQARGGHPGRIRRGPALLRGELRPGAHRQGAPGWIGLDCNMPYDGGGDSVAAGEKREDDEPWTRMQESLDLLYSQVESINTTQQQLVAQMELTAKAVNQSTKDQIRLSKQMQSTGDAIGRLTACQSESVVRFGGFTETQQKCGGALPAAKGFDVVNPDNSGEYLFVHQPSHKSEGCGHGGCAASYYGDDDLFDVEPVFDEGPIFDEEPPIDIESSSFSSSAVFKCSTNCLINVVDANAKRIEEECFSSADKHFKQEPDGDGSFAVQFCAKETSKMMLEVLKQGPRTTAELEAPVVDAPCEPAVFDISGGKRAFIEADEAKELLSPLTKPGNSYKRICFSNRSFGIDAANVVGPILELMKNQLTEVDISDFVAGRPEDEALDVMRIFSKALEGSVLRYLNISDNALGEKGVRAFTDLLKSQENLEELYVMNDGISEEAAKALSELIPSTEKLRVLHFHNNMTGDEGAMSIAEMVKRSPNIESFRCSATRIGSDGGVALAEALGTCTGLTKLDLRDNLFGVDAGIALSKTLPKLPDLVELYLSDLNLENKGTLAIASALKQSAPHLEVLELAGNEINASAAPALAECLRAMQSLKKLTLAENELKDDGAVIIAKSLEEGHTDLKELDVSTNMLQRVGARCFVQAITNKPGFVKLNLNGNFISDEGIDEVKKILKDGKNSLDVLGPLDENDPEGEPDEEEEEEEEDAEDDNGELDSKLQNLKVEQDD